MQDDPEHSRQPPNEDDVDEDDAERDSTMYTMKSCTTVEAIVLAVRRGH